MIVRFSRRAWRDLDDIGAWIGADNPARAQTFVAELIEAGKAVGDFPFLYPVLEVPSSRPLRHRPYGRYLILYELDDRRIEIVRFVHGARNLATLLP